jgi:hypothetical protein
LGLSSQPELLTEISDDLFRGARLLRDSSILRSPLCNSKKLTTVEFIEAAKPDIGEVENVRWSYECDLYELYDALYERLEEPKTENLRKEILVMLQNCCDLGKWFFSWLLSRRLVSFKSYGSPITELALIPLVSEEGRGSMGVAQTLLKEFKGITTQNCTAFKGLGEHLSLLVIRRKFDLILEFIERLCPILPWTLVLFIFGLVSKSDLLDMFRYDLPRYSPAGKQSRSREQNEVAGEYLYEVAEYFFVTAGNQQGVTRLEWQRVISNIKNKEIAEILDSVELAKGPRRYTQH